MDADEEVVDLVVGPEAVHVQGYYEGAVRQLPVGPAGRRHHRCSKEMLKISNV